MENDVNTGEKKISEMGATSNSNISRFAILQGRKKQIEEILSKRNQELRELCIKEAELTGITPAEMPLEPGETLPLIRRRVGTSYQLPESLLKNISNKDELIADLELQIQLHANMAEAALGLANEQNMSKTMKRHHRFEYQKHKNQCIALQEKLALFKEKSATEQLKQKKKLWSSDLSDDNISLGTNVNEPLEKLGIRHSMRSMKHSSPNTNESLNDQRYFQDISRSPYRNSDIPYVINHSIRQEDILNSGFYRLSLNGYNKYMERRESINMYPLSTSKTSTTNYYQYNMTQNIPMQQSPQYQNNNHIQQLSSHKAQNSPHTLHRSTHISQHNQHMSSPNSNSSQHSPYLSQMLQHSPNLSQHSPQLPHHNILLQRSSQHIYNYSPYSSDLNKLPDYCMNNQLPRESSPASSTVRLQYCSSHILQGQPNYRHSQTDETYGNPHQIQPHQQYEQMNTVTSGLGGCWKKSDNGELIWYNSSAIDINWQRDKRFGSLDRRKNKRISKMVSPNLDDKSATLATVPKYQDQIRNASVKSSQVISRRSQDNGQLVRTQSLGSVGAQTIDSVYPSDDNSSCGSDNRLSQSLRKHKEKKWLETSLDGPVSPSHSLMSVSQPMILAPEAKYMNSPPSQVMNLTKHKRPLEIPAESNPTQPVLETNMEIYNNNILQNCTIVQAGHCKPYHEETKPFEMSDFYKYSTKFKKSPTKGENDGPIKASQNSVNVNVSRNLNECIENGSQNLQSYNKSSNNIGAMNKSAPSPNTSLELGQLTVSDNFSAEMNAWYKDQQQNNNNNTGTPSKNRSTATLV